MNVFFEVGLIMIFAGIGTYLAKLIRQPLIPAYIISGIIIGNVLGFAINHELIASLSEIGIAFLLFMVGLELEIKKLRDVGIAATLTGTIQIAALFFIGYFITKIAGFTKIEAVYLGLVIVFSSTMVVVKLLSDKREINTLHGRLTIGILIIQDIFAIIALSYLSSISSSSTGLIFFAKLIAVIAAGIIASKYLFPKIFDFAARSRELLLTTALSVCFLFALIFNKIGTSIAIGAFFAGILLANLPYNIEISGKIRPLRDFFAILFFTALGLQLTLKGIHAVIIPVIILTVVVIIIKPLIINSVLTAMKYNSRTTFAASISAAQISEFSLILAMSGVAAGVVGNNVLTITIVLAILTMTITAYFMAFESKIYHTFINSMNAIGININKHNKTGESKKEYDIILCGHDRMGYSILKTLKNSEKSVVVVDYNPEIIKKLKNIDVPCMYGDFCDSEIMNKLDLSRASMVISTASSYEDNLIMLQKIREKNKNLHIILTAHKIDQALELYEKGADYVILPHFLGGEMVSSILPHFDKDRSTIQRIKNEHIINLFERRSAGHDHPTHIGAH
jgi:Kef-type K+ transport system membrane component KefB/voltage-gated potassium channel Kch